MVESIYNVAMEHNCYVVLLSKLSCLENINFLENDKTIVFQGNKINWPEFKVLLLLLSTKDNS